MKACGACSAWIPDGAAFCPSCGAPQGPGAPPPAPPGGPGPDDGGEPPLDEARAAARVRNLGSLYLATGVLLLLYTAWLFWDVASGAYAAGLRQVLSDMDPNLRGPAERMMGFLLAAPVLLVLHAVPLGLAGLCLWSGIGLRSLRGRTAALVTAVLLAVLCLCTNCCCLLTLPVGIYAIFELTRMDTEAAMARAARAVRP